MNRLLLQTTWRPLDWVVIAGTVYLMFCVVAWTLFDVRSYIHVRLIEPVVAEDRTVTLQIDRSLHRDFSGAYLVDVWRDDKRFCRSGVQYVDYDARLPNGKPTKLPEPVTLVWWAYGGSCTGKLGRRSAEGDLVGRALPLGQYAMQTCHTVLRPWGWVVFPKRECWKLTEWTIE